MRKPVARSFGFKFDQRDKRRAARRAARAAAPSGAPSGVSPFEQLEDRTLFSVLAHYYNDSFWGNGGRPASPTNGNGSSHAFPNQTISVARAGDVTTTVPNVDFDWAGGSPDPAIRADNFSTLFVGKVVAPASGDYEFLGYGDDDIHVFVNGQLVSSDPLGHGAEDPRGTASVGHGGGTAHITLTAGQSYDLVVLHAEGGGGAAARLRWVLPGGDSANPVAVPADNLLATETPVTAPTLSGRDASVTDGVKIDFNDPNTSELRYDLQRRQGNGDWATVTHGAINATSITDYGTQFGASYEYRVVAWNLAGQAVSTNTVAVTTAAEPAAVAGAQGYYFNDQWWKAGSPNPTDGTAVTVGYQPDFTENVGDVNENWGDGNNGTPGSPEPGVIREDNFSTVFTGTITAPETGQYQILGFSDDDSYVFVNGQLVSADPGGHGPPTLVTDIDVRNPITLTAGQSYDFVAVQSEGGGGAALMLRWVTPGMNDAGDTTPIDIPQDAYTSNQPSLPAAPTGLTATVTDVSVIKLAWADASTSEVRYDLERSTSPDFSNATKVLRPINATSYQDSGLTRGTTYYYRLSAENFRGAGTATTSASTPAVAPVPVAPGNLVAYNLGNRNLIQFTDNSVNESGFVVERRLASGGAYAPVAGSPIAGTAANVTGGTISFYDTDNVVPGQTYVYRVRAVNVDNLESANSNEATTALHGLRATYYDSGSVFAARGFYNDISNPSDPFTRIEPNLDVDWGNGSPMPGVGNDTFEANFEGNIQIDTGGNYTFYGESDDGMRVFVDGNLVVDAWVDRGPTETAGTPVTLAAGQHELRVQYYENGGGALARLRYESADAGVTKQIVPIDKLTPAAAGTSPLHAPIQLTASALVGNSINLTWTDTSGGETAFQVQRSTEGTDSGFTTVATLPADQSVYIDSSNLDPSTPYYYRVVAVGTGGATATSDPTFGTYPTTAVSPAVNFPDFADPAVQGQWTLNPRGTPGGGVFVDADGDPNATTERLRLTDGGPDDAFDGEYSSAYYNTPFDITKGFTSSFDFVVGGGTNQSGNPADGFTWNLQAATTSGFPTGAVAVGGGGGALGYAGIGNSVALKFDIYPDLNQTGLYVNGDAISDDPADARNRVLPDSFDINSGQRLHVTVSYDPTSKTLTQTVDDINNPATAPFVTTYQLDLPYVIGSGSAYAGFTGATGGESARQEILSLAFDPSAPAAGGAVSEVYLRGSNWSTAFKGYLGSNGLGDSVLGYRVDNAAAGDIVPWTNVDEIVLRFSAPPTGGGIPQPGTVVIDGVRSDYTVQSVTQLDPQTYVLHLAQPLGGAGTSATNGDRIKLTVPGAGAAGGAYSLNFNVVQGDVNKSGSVLANDYSNVKARFFKSTASPVTGTNDYSPFMDVDGSGSILANDYSAVKARFFDGLPSAGAGSVATASVTRDLFSSTAIL